MRTRTSPTTITAKAHGQGAPRAKPTRAQRPEAMKDVSPEHLADLLARTALRDHAAFAKLYEATRAKLFAVSLRIVGERPLAEEVLQDTFVNIWNHARDYAPSKSAPLTWMFAIARNRSLDIVR